MGTIAVVGSLNIDLVVGLERMPDPGETVLGHTFERHAGGKGLNQAVAAARLGASVAMIGALGTDDNSAWMRGILLDEGIDDRAVATSEGPSGTALIEVDDAGRNRIVVVPGANGTVSANAVAAALENIADLAIVLTQGEVPIPAIEAAMTVGRARGAITVLNPAPAIAYPPALLRAVDYVVPNEFEAHHLTGVATGTEDGCRSAAQALIELGARCAIITRGGEGSLWMTAEGSGTVPVFPVNVVDTVAAGDAFCGGFVTALAEGRAVDEALRWATATGGLVTTRKGAVPSLPKRAEVEQLLG